MPPMPSGPLKQHKQKWTGRVSLWLMQARHKKGEMSTSAIGLGMSNMPRNMPSGTHWRRKVMPLARANGQRQSKKSRPIRLTNSHVFAQELEKKLYAEWPKSWMPYVNDLPKAGTLRWHDIGWWLNGTFSEIRAGWTPMPATDKQVALQNQIKNARDTSHFRVYRTPDGNLHVKPINAAGLAIEEEQLIELDRMKEIATWTPAQRMLHVLAMVPEFLPSAISKELNALFQPENLLFIASLRFKPYAGSASRCRDWLYNARRHGPRHCKGICNFLVSYFGRHHR